VRYLVDIGTRGGNDMHSRLTPFVVALMGATGIVGVASAQPSYPCANGLPNPYHLVSNWAQTPRPWGPVNAVTVDARNNLWAVDRCEEDGCKPVFELGPDGKTIRNFGAGLFVEPHASAVDKD